jgi:hypothetical protein
MAEMKDYPSGKVSPWPGICSYDIPQTQANSDLVSKAFYAGNLLDRYSILRMSTSRQLHCASRNVWYSEV